MAMDWEKEPLHNHVSNRTKDSSCWGLLTMCHSEPLGAGSSEDVYFVLGREAQVPQTRTDIVCKLLKLDKANVLVWRQLEVGPILVDLLLLAIDHLLDLFRLDVRVDDFAGAHGLCVAKLCGSILEELVEGANVVGRLQFEGIFGLCIPARNGLARDLLDASYLDRHDASLDGSRLRVDLLGVLRHGDSIRRLVPCGCGTEQGDGNGEDECKKENQKGTERCRQRSLW